jgi:hypothetical protein
MIRSNRGEVMRNACLLLLALSLLVHHTSAAEPATRLAEMEPLLDGSIRYVPPGQGWKLLGKSENNLKASYATEDGHGRMEIDVTPQPRDVPETAAQQMAMIIGKGIRDQAKQSGRELLLQPRVEKDPRFFLVIHVRMRGAADENVGTADERVNDMLHLYRVMGLNIVHVVVSAMVGTEEEAAPIHDAAKEVLAGMLLTRGVGPVVFPKANLKITPPIDWKLAKSDQPNGLVATYTTAESKDRQIIVRARIIPKDAREDTVKRDNFLDRMTDEERRTAPFSASAKPGQEQAGSDEKSLRRVQTTLQRGEAALSVITRYFVVGDVLVSVRSVSEQGDESTAKLADALAQSMKPVRE